MDAKQLVLKIQEHYLISNTPFQGSPVEQALLTNKNTMSSAIFTADDGSTVELHDQAYTDAAVATAVAAVPTTGTPAEVTEVDVKESDGTDETFVPEAPVEPAA